jgi:membrane-associated phospholipid phosphatase
VGVATVRSSESLPFVYFVACAVFAGVRPLPAARRAQIVAISLPMCAAIGAVASYGVDTVRDWAPGVSILVGYYVSGRFFVTPSAKVEQWLIAWDRRLLGDPPTRFAAWPRALLAYLEIVYMGCFLVVPAGFAILAASGRADLADRYWTIVAAAEFGSFAPLVVIQTRPPWMLERKPVLADRAVHRAASQMIEHFTIRANTFPSGHVAGSLAVAFALVDAMPWIGAAALLLAVSIGVATVVGRYHYVIDGVAGAALAIAVWTMVKLAGI